jgi:prevent-host-death family protein
MRIDTDDLVSATELSRNSPWLLKEASQGRRFVIVKGNTPTAALISIDDLKTLASVAPATAGYRPGEDTSPQTFGLHPFLATSGISDVSTWDPCRSWDHSPDDIFVQLGVSEEGPVTLNLGEFGPHGMLAGMTGCGKSSCVEAIVLSLCANYSPGRVQIAIATSSGFDELKRLPHVSVFDELKPFADWASTVMAQRSSGGARRDDPALIVILDEPPGWSTPEFTRLLDRLLGQADQSRVHLLITSQRGLPRRFVAQMNYRIAMRVHDASASREIIGSARAAELKGRGQAYLVVGRPSDHFATRLQLSYAGDLAQQLVDRICAAVAQ